ncbi:mandelate racemase/muconate lactonizing enzyme family protein [Paenibacillus senegalensis]|uniref:mandelate racemase/muconate lactonizing enzyme family protein n=1 Tax=Paenibacillus senegalensis TaxID=1465766 RepID=UPI00028A2E65|nr:mandelate racemase/muconate lactonizing enzyme family protein [Paenibacillus senegalensis]
MRIDKIETYSTPHLCVVRITTEDGLSGIGQTAPDFTDITCRIVHRQLAPLVLGMDAGQIEEISDRCIESTYKFYGSYICRAAAGIDTALWDLKAKRAGKGVAQLLGSTASSVDVYGSSMDKTITPKLEADRMKALMQDKGFRAFKLHIGKGIGKNLDMYPGRTEEVVSLVRQALGSDSELYVDSKGAYDVNRAIELGRLFEQLDIGFFEEPCPFWQMEKSAEVARTLSIPVAGGEQDFCLAQWGRIIEQRALSIAQPDILSIGGLTRALRVARMAEKAGLYCTPHNSTHSLLQVFSIHMYAALANAYPFLEISIDQEYLDPWTKNFFYPAVEVKDGKVKVPREPVGSASQPGLARQGTL